MLSATPRQPRDVTDRFVHLGRLRFHYRDCGPPAAPPVMVLHGIMGHAREWDVLTEALARRFRVLVVDQRGHGETDWAEEYTAAALSGDLAALIELLGLPPVRLIGHSMGGMAAALCAADRPDLVDRVVLVDIGPDSLRTEFGTQLQPLLTSMGHASYATVDEALDEWLAGNPLARPSLLRHDVEHCLVRRADGRLGWRFDALRLARFGIDGVSEQQLWDSIDRIIAPTLVIRGAHSELLAPATARMMLRRLRQATLVEIPDAGHDLGVEQPEAVAAATLDFLGA
jgi:esterase